MVMGAVSSLLVIKLYFYDMQIHIVTIMILNVSNLRVLRRNSETLLDKKSNSNS